jgi:hypothetical protein
LLRDLFTVSKDRKSLHLLLPGYASYIESRHDYTLLSALAEFFGIAGLFFGMSAYGCISSIMSTISAWSQFTSFQHMSKCSFMKRYFMKALCFTLLGLVLWIITGLVSKFISYPVASQVTLVKDIPPMAIAVCRSKYMTSFNYRNKSFHSVTTDTIFWEDGFNLQKKITSIKIMNSKGDWMTIWAIMQPTLISPMIFSKIIFPLNNQTLQFCDIFDLEQYQDSAKVRPINYFL